MMGVLTTFKSWCSSSISSQALFPLLAVLPLNSTCKENNSGGENHNLVHFLFFISLTLVLFFLQCAINPLTTEGDSYIIQTTEQPRANRYCQTQDTGLHPEINMTAAWWQRYKCPFVSWFIPHLKMRFLSWFQNNMFLKNMTWIW